MEAPDLQLHIMNFTSSGCQCPVHEWQSSLDSPRLKQYRWWLKMAIYTLFVLSGQAVAILLGRLYYEKGGKSKWVATLVQPAGFPILLPLLCISTSKNHTPSIIQTDKPSPLILASIYLSIGLLLAADCMLYSIGLLYLPVSTYSLISASQLAFNAFFSYWLNSQKLTPLILNSLVLLTFSSALLIFQPNSTNPNEISKGKYTIGFVCTVFASAGYGLVLSLTQLVYCKVLKTESFKVVLKMIIYPGFVATCATVVGLFASGDWKGLKTEMEEFRLGKLSYVMTLIWTAVAWQVFSIGAIGLIFQVSSLFCNAISALGLPIVPVFAVIFFHDKMDGLKVIAMLLAIWGFLSYVYQHYLNDSKPNKTNRNANEASETSPAERD